MAYAHDQGIVHRDLKPSNIMLGPYGETLVMDWGLAKALDGDGSRQRVGGDAPSPSPSPEDLTATGIVLGTPQYMSPEQAKGQPAGPASDIFSLGLIFYAILTGKSAYDEASLQARTRSRRCERRRSCRRDTGTRAYLALWKRSASRPCRPDPRIAILPPALWPKTSRNGWPMNRSRPGASRGPSGARRWAKRHRTAVAATAAGLCGRAALGRDRVVRLSAAGEAGDRAWPRRPWPEPSRPGATRGQPGPSASTRRPGAGPRTGPWNAADLDSRRLPVGLAPAAAGLVRGREGRGRGSAC